MGGKSCFLRQTALIAIMAQCGSFVPADSATLTVTDAIYTRMGAYDHLAAGLSTFKVELDEAGRILRCATRRSLVVIDELGRGTATHDGTAIAFATLQHLLHGPAQHGCRCLFVTHFPLVSDGLAPPDHSSAEELSEIEVAPAPAAAAVIKRRRVAQAMHMSYLSDRQIDREQDADGTLLSDQSQLPSADVTFLYKLTEGKASRSFGLNVARMAGIKAEVLRTAAAKSDWLEQEAVAAAAGKEEAAARQIMAIADQGEDLDAEQLSSLWGQLAQEREGHAPTRAIGEPPV
jgi:DNA mismatch repair protein MSH3